MDWRSYLSDTPAADYMFQEQPYEEQIRWARAALEGAEAVLIGAGAGLSAAAGLTYSGKRFTENFAEFIERYGPDYMRDMYAAGFYPFGSEEERWGYWSKHVYMNRILPEGLPLYKMLHDLVKNKDYFVLTTNVDHQFWKAGFVDARIFATQGDYGLIQCKKACHDKTYDAVRLFLEMNQERRGCRIPSNLIPRCPVCKGPMAVNLRCDQFFVEDKRWNEAAQRYGNFLERVQDKRLVLLELGVGFNTPVIIRFPFEKMTAGHDRWSLIRINRKDAAIPGSLGERAVGINQDIGRAAADLRNQDK